MLLNILEINLILHKQIICQDNVYIDMLKHVAISLSCKKLQACLLKKLQNLSSSIVTRGS